MNLFEDLIIELKEENLLEKTVTDPEAENDFDWDQGSQPEDLSLDFTDESQDDDDQAAVGEPSQPLPVADSLTEDNGSLEIASEPAAKSRIPPKPRNGREFYKKRAVGEISNLQMVEHVITGIEREYLKVVPRTFDDFAAKKALNAFLQVAEDENSSEHAEAEFDMMQETEAWCTALSDRDKSIPVSSVRQYCENSRPALSSQALVSLARFYRNLPYCEAVRAKFDFIITRLFSRSGANHKRVALFTRDEMTEHIKILYKEWSSISLYSADEDESKVLLTALSFEELAVEAESTSTFDQLIKSDFFGRLRTFKESVSEVFFAPNVAAAAIECNIRVGNAYVSLIESARTQMDSEAIASKFEDLDSGALSDAAAGTLDILTILRTQRDRRQDLRKDRKMPERSTTVTDSSVLLRSTQKKDVGAKVAVEERVDVEGKGSAASKLFQSLLAVNRWLLLVSAVLVAASIGIYFWSNYLVEDNLSSAAVKSVDIENAVLAQHVKTARISGQNFYVLLSPSWDTLPREKQQEFLKSTFEFAQERGSTQVSLINSTGKSVGHASASKMEITTP